MTDLTKTDRASAPLGDISPVAWVGIPLVSLAIVLLAPLMGFEAWNKYFMGGHDAYRKEFTFLEITPLFFLAPTVWMGITLFVRRRRFPPRVGTIMLLVAIAAFYYMGEESSWGQHYLGYKTPEKVRKINRQGEFNLHNNQGIWKTIFNRIPREAASVSMIAGAIMPFCLRRRRRDPQWNVSFWGWVLPTFVMVPVCFLAAVINLGATPAKEQPSGTYFNMA
ncbi:MAG: hypothetical protein NT031_00840, partial [Planctomycetota bacterium]|nr:hypothetical protein [Planctomycetota bacterium]